ncbi:MAG: S8 family peptidase [Chitinophagales bacterium]
MPKHLFIRKIIIGKAVLLLSIFFSTRDAIAQENSLAETITIFNKIADTSSQRFDESRPHYLAFWEHGIPNSAKIVRQLNIRTAIIEVTSQLVLDSLQQRLKISAANDQWKFSPFADRIFEKKTGELQQFILSSSNIDTLLAFLQEVNPEIRIIAVDRPSKSVSIRATARFIAQKLAPTKEVTFIDVRAEPHSEISIIGYNRSFHGINAVDHSLPGANGKNIVAGVKEQRMDETDIDLYKRVLSSAIASPNVTNHATVISTIIGGAGNSFYDGRGIANGCRFFSSSFDNLFADDAVVLNANRVTVQNHSYGTVIQQFYGAEAVSYDVHSWLNKNFVHVFSAGNRGASFATDGKYSNIAGYANLTGNFKMAKNIITVGAIDNKGNIPAESSAGPVYDGRLAPQLIALGPNGTSDAAAVVTGTIAVMQQVFADSNGQLLPPASLIKAVLFNTAEDIFNPGIDYKTGYGLLNSYAAIKSIGQKEYDGSLLSQGQQWTKTISVPANAAQIKLTLCWTDSAAPPNNNRALINDLDIELVHVGSGTIYKPWGLSAAPHVDSLAKLPVRKRDSLNTAEQISIVMPVAGNYQVRVTGTTVINSPIVFHLSYHTDTLNTFWFTNPQHTSDVNRDENPNLEIRWKIFVADTNQTGSLYISYNNGTNWQLIKAGYKIYTNYYPWPVKDTSSRAMLKMETGFGDFLSKEFVISKVTRPVVDFLCADSFRLSWPRHIYANAYKIYTLTDSPYLKHLVTAADTFIVMKRSVYPNLVYAIEPILSNNIPAARSIAIDITAQAVKCFYKTLYYHLHDLNKLELVLELSSPGYVDSIYFERVTAAGQWIKTVGGTKVNGANPLYNQSIDDVPEGTSYWRARIKLNNGAIIYTDNIAVLTTGRKFILFYPNPVNRNSSLTYLLRQNLPTNSKLQLFDISGRLLRSYSEIPNTINLRTIATGVVIYKLFSNDNQVLETGKLLIID